ncbi:MAG: toll/interleukin-1 receptor domain-containing protein [Bacteroidetes bacterium]|nr:MAG: toll/interleukin-1 receptor domain-containing protein [Bacteroidota bacterium]
MASVFISYSHKDEVWKDRLLPHLRMLEKAGKPITLWDDRKIDAGATWYNKIKEAMEQASVAVCLISADYLSSDFCVKEEIPFFLERRKNEGMVLIPVLIRPCAWKAIDWLKAIQMIPRDGQAVAVHFKENWDTPFAIVAEEILSAVEQRKAKVQTPPLVRWSPPEQVDISRLPVTGAELFGRHNELKLLDDAWDSAQTNVISFVAWGGVGKSTLINKWVEQMGADNYRGAQRVYAWSFYSQGTGERVTSADIFIAKALEWFGDPDPTQGSPWDKGQRLAELVRSKETLLLLDGMEPLQSPLKFERGKIKDPALAMLVTELAKENPGLCVITTREPVVDLADYSTTTHQIDLEQISPEAGRTLLRVGGVQGTDIELEKAARDFGPHALALNLLAAYIHEIPGHHISNASKIPDIDVPVDEGKHPRRVMEAFAERFGDSAEVNLLRILGLFSSPADKKEIGAVRAAPAIPNLTEHLQTIKDNEWHKLINRLRRVKLIATESSHRPDTLDAHPLVREHFGSQLQQKYPDAWREGNNRLYEYYKATAKKYPDTLEEMAPLYAAVMHGCRAERHQEALDDVYWERINRNQEFFSTDKLGALGTDLSAISGFFNTPWSQPVATLSEWWKGFLLNAAGFRLRSLGRLAEAVQPMQAALKTALYLEDWNNAARYASNLSGLYLTTGKVEQALNYAQQSVELADRSGDAFMKMITRAGLADAIHQSGQLTEAEALFREAEQLQKERQPEFTLLYSLSSFHYCTLLLSQNKYQDVQLRASQTIKIATENNWLLDIALDNLSLGNAHLIQSQREPYHPFTESQTHLNRAVDGLRQAGTQDYMPFGLLARAEYYRVTNSPTLAKRDLDEAFSIAKRCGMGLHLANCHLEYARLYVGMAEAQFAHPSTPLHPSSPLHPSTPLRMTGSEGREMTLEELKQQAREHLAIAKKKINEMGYHRRDREVEELERLIG